ncbi:hypothetical protein ACN6LA_000710 [Streptomyces sp. SAS_269]|uniref:hypothetical protein n=1 Tax=Streptomyces sp. SAS_269 TaxID=3412749 RepID=UPI00403CB966
MRRQRVNQTRNSTVATIIRFPYTWDACPDTLTGVSRGRGLCARTVTARKTSATAAAATAA